MTACAGDELVRLRAESARLAQLLDTRFAAALVSDNLNLDLALGAAEAAIPDAGLKVGTK